MRSKRAIINIISTLILQLITVAYGVLIPRLIISKYGSNVNGLITSITQFLAFITLLEGGFGPVVKSLLYKPIAKQDREMIAKILKASEKIFKKISVFFVIYIIVLIIMLPTILSNNFSYLYTASLIVIIAISTFAEYYFGITYKLYLNVMQKTYINSIIQASTLVLNTVIVLILINTGVNIHIVKITSTMVFVLRPIMQNIYVKKKYGIDLKNTKDDYKMEQKWDGLAQHIASVIHENSDVAILTLCGNLVQVSIYSIYAMITNSIRNIIRAFSGGIDSAFGDMIAKGEKENLNKSFKIYEAYYFTVSTILYSCTIFLILPFIKVYTNKITDVNYVQPTFAYLIVTARMLFILRQPYNDLIKVSGHFKQTKKGAYIEAILNLTVSFALVWKLGLEGVAIGTLIAMIARTVDFVRYTSKHILNRSINETLKKYILVIIEIAIVYLILRLLPKVEVYNYKTWILSAINVVSVTSVTVIIINGCMYKDSFKKIIGVWRKKHELQG